MKSILMILGITTILVFEGCEDYLYKEPIGLLTPDQVNTDPTLTSVKYSVSSSYQLLSSTLNIIGEWGWDDGIVTRNDFILQDIASDDMQKKWNPDGDQAWMDKVCDFTFTSQNQALNGIWVFDYEGARPAVVGRDVATCITETLRKCPSSSRGCRLPSGTRRPACAGPSASGAPSGSRTR